MKFVEILDLIQISVDCLDDNDEKNLNVALKLVDTLLDIGRKYFVDSNRENIFAVKFSKLGGGSILEKLQSNKNKMIYEKAIQILEYYFEVDDFV